MDHRRLAAIMFLDVVDFSALTQRDESRALRRLEESQRLLRPLFEAHGGRVVKSLGDGYLLEFGSALAATECAIDIQRRMFEASQSTAGEPVELRIGIHLGDVELRDGDILGDAVNIAARIEPLAEASGICITGPVADQVGNKIPYPCVQLDHAFLKNIRTPIAVYSIDLPWHAPPAARVTPMTDRTVELGSLREALKHAAQREGAVVALRGESGIGKTRLAEEAIARAEGAGFRILRGRRFEEGVVTPYAHWAQAARMFTRDAPSPLLYKVCDGCQREAIGLVPELADRLGTLPRAPPVEPAQARVRFFEGLTRFLLNIAKEAPLVLLLDDFQWADPDSVALLAYVGGQLREQPVLLLVTYRDTEMDPQGPLAMALFDLRRLGLLREISLGRFGPQNGRELVGAVLGGADPPPALVDPVLEKTGGNPLFVEELCRSLVEDRSLVRTPDGWHAKPDARIEVPSTVKEVIRRRVGRIGPDAENVLSVASVFGNEFDFDRLQEVTEVEPDRLLLLVEAMLRARLLREKEVAPGRSVYQFGDEQTQEVFYGGLSLVRRQRFHLKAGQALERAWGKDGGEHAGELATHFLLGHEPRKALEYYIRAGNWAAQVFAREDAAAAYARALELLQAALPREPEPRALQARAVEVAGLLGDNLWSLGRQEEAMAAYLAGTQSVAGADSVTQATAWVVLGYGYQGQHRYDDALACGARAEQALGPLDPRSQDEAWQTRWTSVQRLRMSVAYWRNDVTEYAAALDRIRPLMEGSTKPRDRLRFYADLRSLDWRRNRGVPSVEGMEYARKALEIAKELGGPEDIAGETFSLGFMHFWRGEASEARPYLTAALRTFEELRLATGRSRAMTYLMVTERRAGEVAAAERLVPEVLAAAEVAKLPEYSAMADATEAWVAWRTGKPDLALEQGKRALQIWHEIPNSYPCDWMAIWPLTAIVLERHDVPGAIDLVRGLLPLSQNPMPPELDTLVRRAIASQEAGDSAAAASALSEALAAARRMHYA